MLGRPVGLSLLEIVSVMRTRHAVSLGRTNLGKDLADIGASLGARLEE